MSDRQYKVENYTLPLRINILVRLLLCYTAKTELSLVYISTYILQLQSTLLNRVIQWPGVRGGWGGGAHQQPISAPVPYDTDREASHMFPEPPLRPSTVPPSQSDCQTGLLIGRQDHRQYYKPIKAIGTDCQVMSSTA